MSLLDDSVFNLIFELRVANFKSDLREVKSPLIGIAYSLKLLALGVRDERMVRLDRVVCILSWFFVILLQLWLMLKLLVLVYFWFLDVSWLNTLLLYGCLSNILFISLLNLVLSQTISDKLYSLLGWSFLKASSKSMFLCSFKSIFGAN